MKTLISIKTVLFCLLMSFSSISLAATVIHLQHRSANEIIPLIQPLADDKAVLIGDKNRLIIKTNRDNLLELRQAITVLDQANTNLTIDVWQDASLSELKRHFALRQNQTQLQVGQILIEPNQSTDRIIRVGQRKTTSQHYSIQVEDNHEAIISHSLRRQQLQAGFSADKKEETLFGFINNKTEKQRAGSFQEQRLDSGLRLLPRLQGNNVQLSIAPINTQVHGQDVQESSSATTVTVPLGQWLVIAVDRNSNRYTLVRIL